MVERHFDVVDVRGSTPLSPTNVKKLPQGAFLHLWAKQAICMACDRGVEDLGDVLALQNQQGVLTV